MRIHQGIVSERTLRALVAAKDHPELGETATRLDGSFDYVVNAGGMLTLTYAKPGYLTSHRQVQTTWQRFVRAPDVRLVAQDAAATPITFGASSMQVATATATTDADGTRQLRLFVPPQTKATMQFANGATAPLPSGTLRLTEYTVGAQGKQRMPSDLPCTSAYTYAAELAFDEAEQAGASSVVFDQPVYAYVENFLGLTVGSIVPIGSYDRTAAVWKGVPDGRVIQVLSVSSGVAEVDADGDGAADSEAALTTLGFTLEERQRLAQTYAAGTKLLRSPFQHFTPGDCNVVAGGCNGGACKPPDGGPSGPSGGSGNDEPNSCEDTGSILFCENQALGESVPVTGTPLRLVYNSSRTPGRSDFRELTIPLVGATVPSALREVKLTVDVAGQHHEASFAPSANLSTTYHWDGFDAFARLVQGRTDAVVSVGYVYGQGIYELFSSYQDQGVSFPVTIGGTGAQGTLRYDLEREGRSLTIWNVQTLEVGGWNQPPQQLGGWALHVHHSYVPTSQTLYLGTGKVLPASFLGDVADCALGCGTQGIPDGGFDGTQLARDSKLKPLHLVATPDGGYLFTVSGGGSTYPGGSAVVKVDRQGRLFTWARTPGFYVPSDGPALALLDEDNLLVLRDGRLWRVNVTGEVTRVAGADSCGVTPSGDGGPARDACFANVDKVAVGRDGSIYVADTTTIRRITPNGLVTHFAGQYNANQPYLGEGGPATDARIEVLGLATGPRGEVYVGAGTRVFKIGCDGVITTYAGTGTTGHGGEEGPAVNAPFGVDLRVASAPDGSLFVAEVSGTNCSEDGNHLRRIDPSGIMHAVASGHGCNSVPYGSLVPGGHVAKTHISAGALTLLEGGTLLAHNSFNGDLGWWSLRPSLPGFSNDTVLVASQDGSEAYLFDRDGRHLSTRDTRLGRTLYTFGYDPSGRLVSVTDTHGLVTAIERAADGSPKALVAPHGQRTELALDAHGHLASVTNPASESFQFSTTSTGLLVNLTDPRQGLHTFSYDGQGRLVRDDDAAGGFKTLTRSGVTSTGRTVTIATALGRATTYALDNHTDGSQARSVTNSAGLVTSVARSSADDTVVTSPDGTLTRMTMAADPRFGLASLYPSRVETQLPSGLTRVETMTRQATLTDPANPLSVTDWTDTQTLGGHTWTTHHDLATHTETTTSPLGLVTTRTFNAKGDLVHMEVPGMVPWTFGYDAEGKRTTVSQTDGTTTRSRTMTYAPTGYLATVLDSLNQLTTYEHDAVGRVTLETRPDQQSTAFGYDAADNLTAVTPPGQPTHQQSFTLHDDLASYTPPALPGTGATSYVYDADHQLATVTDPTSEVVGHGYDSAGRLASVTTAQGSYGYSYDAITGLTTGITAPGGQNLAFDHDGTLLAKVTWSGVVNGTYERSFDALFRPSSEKVNGGAPVVFGYDADGRMTQAGPLSRVFDPATGLVQALTIGAVTDTWTYNAFGEIQSYQSNANNTMVYGVTYSRDNGGRLSGKVETLQGVTRTLAYSYDMAGRLTDVMENSQTTEHYEYDTNGNRVLGVVAGVSSVGAYDAQDRLLSYGSLTFTYNARGDLESQTDTSTSQVTTYQYDAFGNLRHVHLPNGNDIEYVIDGQSRRVGKRVNGVWEAGWLYRDSLQPVAELDSSGQVRQQFVKINGEPGIRLVVEGGKNYLLLNSQTGGVRAAIDATTGQVVLDRRADSFGFWQTQTGSWTTHLDYNGRIYDDATRWVRVGSRDYAPKLGRWTTRDQALLEGRQSNLYVYSINDPVNHFDPTGRFAAVLGGVAWTAADYAIAGIAGATIAGGGLYIAWDKLKNIKWPWEKDAPTQPEPQKDQGVRDNIPDSEINDIPAAPMTPYTYPDYGHCGGNNPMACLSCCEEACATSGYIDDMNRFCSTSQNCEKLCALAQCGLGG